MEEMRTATRWDRRGRMAEDVADADRVVWDPKIRDGVCVSPGGDLIFPEDE